MAAIEDDLRPRQQRYGELRVPLRVLYGEGNCILDRRTPGRDVVRQAAASGPSVIPGGHMIPVT
jgi:hypothetical protein